MSEFTADYFSQHIPNWEQWLGHLRGGRVSGVEIGSYEGRSTLWLMEHIFTHAESRLFCVDTWQGGGELPAVEGDALMNRFRGNLAAHAKRLRCCRGKSVDELPVLRAEPRPGALLAPKLDFVYVDGSHAAPDVLTDAVMAWPMLKPDGVLIFDDYAWKLNPLPVMQPCMAIDAFLSCFPCTVLHKGYQVAVRKI